MSRNTNRSSAATASSRRRPLPPRSLPVLVTLLLSSTLTVMDGGVVAPALPAIEQHFADSANVEIVTRLLATIPSLSIAVCALLAGTLVDRVGRKPILLGSVALFALSGASGLVLDDLYAILVSRVLLGLALAGVMTGATTLIADYYPAEQRSRVFGLQTAFMGVGGAVFAVLGGILAEISWRTPFAAYLVAVLLVVPIALWLPETAPRATSAEPGERVPEPAGDLRRTLTLLVPLAVLGMVVFYLALTQLPFHLDDAFGVGAAGSGMALGTLALFQFLAAVSYGRLSARFGMVAVTVVSYVALGAGYALVGVGSLAVVVVGLAVAGVGGGLLIPSLTTWSSAATSEAARGRVLGGLMGAIFLGQFLSPILAHPIAVTSGYGPTFLAAAGLAALLALVVAVVSRSVHEHHRR